MIVAPERIPVAGPSITEREVELAQEAARTAWYQNHYAFNARFERMLAEYVSVRYTVSVPHCTAALHLALAALGIGPGDEVIVPDVTWIASVAPVVYVGADPVLVDIRVIRGALSRCRGSCDRSRHQSDIGVDLYGSVCDWDQLNSIAEKHGLFLMRMQPKLWGLNTMEAGPGRLDVSPHSASMAAKQLSQEKEACWQRMMLKCSTGYYSFASRAAPWGSPFPKRGNRFQI